MSTQNANGSLFTTVFDAASRPIASISPLGYLSTAVYDVANQGIAQQNALGYLSTVVLDAVGRAIASVNTLGSRWTTVFDAASRPIAMIDPLANMTTAVFSPNGSRIASQDARGYLTSFVLDAASQLIAVVAANGGITSSLFDQRGLMLASQDPLSAFTSYQFDAVGNTILRTDARNRVTSYTLDALNRTVGTLYVDSTRVTNTFDAAGQPITAQDVTGITSFAFDLDGRQISVLYPAGNALTYSLDPVGNRLLLVDPDNGLTSYSWDAQNRLVGIVNPFNEFTTIQWDALDREQLRVLGNGMNVSHTFDGAGREIVLSNASPTGTALALFTNSYDPVGNRLSVSEIDGSLVSYLYDPSYQLINEQRSGTTPYNTTFVYDGMGNRLVQNNTGVLTTSTFNAANELLTSEATISTTAIDINCGGAATSPFVADTDFSGGTPASVITPMSTAGVTNPAPSDVYRSLRYGSFSYTIPGFTPSASYTVRLHFAEIVYTSSGSRVFDVAINGTNVLTSFDIFALAGANQALIEQFTATADGSGNIAITFTAIVDNPQINGIEILGGSSPVDINCGSGAVAPFVADTDFSGGTAYNLTYPISVAGVSDPAPQDVYRTLRYGSFSYTIPSLTPGANYTVRLHFAEFVFTSAGQRVFDVAINGTTVLTNFDIIATCGSRNQALIEEFTATADGSGNISVTVSAITDNPQINGIEVLGGSSAGVTTNTFDPNGNLLTATTWTGVTSYTWDSENRLLSVASDLNGTETYTYASDGMRRQKVTSAQTTSFIWDGQNVLQERNVSNLRLAQYTDYPGYWGGLASGRQGSTSSFCGFDSQASTRILVNIGGVVTDNYAYTGFGLELAQGTAPQSLYTTNPYRFKGQASYYRDSLINIIRNEYYRSDVGRRINRNTPTLWNTIDAYLIDANNPLSDVPLSVTVGERVNVYGHEAKMWTVCGQVEVDVNFKIRGNQMRSGWIIQHITFKTVVFDCAKPPNPYPNPRGFTGQYWEAFRVVNGQVFKGCPPAFDPSQPNDVWLTPLQDRGTQSRGYGITLTGVAQFFRDYDLQFAPKGPWQCRYSPPVNGLPAIFSPPKGWTDFSGTVRKLEVSWCCCGNEDDYKSKMHYQDYKLSITGTRIDDKQEILTFGPP